MLKRLGFPEAIFSINSFVAAMLALYIAFSIGLPRPYWAMLTVYITVQPLSGSLRSKAAYRVIGTVLGGVAAVALVPNLVNSPIVLSVALVSQGVIQNFRPYDAAKLMEQQRVVGADGKPTLVIDLSQADAVASADEWLETQRARFGAGLRLGIGGPRESEVPGIYELAYVFLMVLFSKQDTG